MNQSHCLFKVWSLVQKERKKKRQRRSLKAKEQVPLSIQGFPPDSDNLNRADEVALAYGGGVVSPRGVSELFQSPSPSSTTDKTSPVLLGRHLVLGSSSLDSNIQSFPHPLASKRSEVLEATSQRRLTQSPLRRRPLLFPILSLCLSWQYPSTPTHHHSPSPR